jgi:rhamnogalacturonyl hydrolase YesR
MVFFTMLAMKVRAEDPTTVNTAYLSHFPDGTGPNAVGAAVAQHFVASPHQYTFSMHYSEVVAWYGALTFADASKNAPLRDSLIRRFEPLMPGGAETNRVPVRHHVDDSVFGVVPLEIARQTHDPRYLKVGLAWADRQWEQPRPDGLSGETRFWIDDMYMITLLQVEAYRASHESKYLDRAALEMSAYLDQLQQPGGLFFHAQDVPIYWGRGNGWVAAGMAELLSELPENHPQHARILKGYRLMMACLLQDQGRDGMWRQLLDHDEAWPETSSTGMFAFAMISGVKHGWLDGDVYGPAARRAWIGLVGYVDQNGDMTNVCEGTDKKNDMSYYLSRKRHTGDFHGQAPVLWAATAMLR